MSISYWVIFDSEQAEQIGFLPDIFRKEDPRPAKEQANERYAHGGGWQPQPEWDLDPDSLIATFPGDPPMLPIALSPLHDDEAIVLYPHGYVCVIRSDDTFEMARMD